TAPSGERAFPPEKGGRTGTLATPMQRLFYRLSVLLSRTTAFFSRDHHKLHAARFARLHEFSHLLSGNLDDLKAALLLGMSHFNRFVCVRPTKTRSELGNLMVVATTRGGKGLLAVTQLLTTGLSCLVNDIKGDLFTQTAGYRNALGPVFVIDPTGVGDRFDP